MHTHPVPYTCLSNLNHDGRVSDVVLHYFGCLPRARRRQFLDSLPPDAQQRIFREEQRIARLRARLQLRPESGAGTKLKDFEAVLREWRQATGRPTTSTWPLADDASRVNPFELDEGVDADIKAPVVFFKGSRPYTHPNLAGVFPHQKVTVKDLLTDDPSRSPLMEGFDREAQEGGDDDTIRYVHLPANNMIWVEEAVARYYGEQRPHADDLLFNSRLRRSRTKTEMLLRQEFWQGQQGAEANHSEVHARHMRGMCDVVSIDQVATEMRPKNLVLFMPYLHWQTDRGRIQTAAKIKDVSKDRLTLAELLAKAKNRLSRTPTNNHGDQEGLLARVPTIRHHVQATGSHPNGVVPHRPKRHILGDLLRVAAALLEAMEFNTEEQLIAEYLHARPPLHPRRTLDQSYYGALKSTGTRDRDQVVYRATTPEPHEHEPCWEECVQCREDIRKIPRLIMVDQLWLWILDEKTVISSFPRRWCKSKSDPSAVHKSIRQRLKFARTDEISSAYDLALVIIDEASRVFFDRTKTNDRQPNMVDMFADAIRGVTYKQTAAFDQFLIYTDLASREYKRQRNADTATQNHLLNINSEGSLLKEVKDIMDEIHIITRIKEQQQIVMESFVKHLRRAILPTLRSTSSGQKKPFSSQSSWDVVLQGGPWPYAEEDPHLIRSATIPTSEDEKQRERKERARLTLARADLLLRDIRDRILELNQLLENARNTSAALKDLLTLKQQQAGVIEAREAVKQAAETLKQGQSIMLFTVVTIIFLPLSFCATLFGMNSAEFNDGHMTLTQEFVYMFPISAAIILTSFLLAFSHSPLTQAFSAYLRNSISLVYNTAVTWIMVKTGLYMLGRALAVRANQIKDREIKLTGSMKAEVMRESNNLEKMKAASTMRRIADRKNTDQLPGTPRPPLTPYGAPGTGSPFLGTTRKRTGGSGSGSGSGMEDVELGHRKGSSQAYLVHER